MPSSLDIHIFSFSTLPNQRLLLFLGETWIFTVLVDKKELKKIRVPRNCHRVRCRNFPRVSDLLEDIAWVELCWLLSSFEMEERTTLQDIIETLVLLEEAQSATIH